MTQTWGPVSTPRWDYVRWVTDLLDACLPLHGVPWTPQAPHEELSPFYELAKRLDPAYFREEEVRIALRQCPTLEEEPWTQWMRQLLSVVRKTQLTPQSFRTRETLEAWWGLFPEACSWEAVGWLAAQGVRLPYRWKGARVWKRYTQGTDDPGHARDWMVACQTAGWATPEEVDRAAAWLGGAWEHLAGGACGRVPLCESCPLQTDCCWAQVPQASGALPQKNSELLEWILQDCDEKEQQALVSLTAGQPLVSALAAETLQLRIESPRLRDRLHALREVCQRYGTTALQPGAAFRSSQDLFHHFQQRLRDKKQEQFIVVILDNKHRYLEERVVTQGLLNRSLVHPREVFAGALERRAAAIICLHNHPSGDPEPSQEDHRITARLVESGKILGIPLLDHLVIGEGRYVSFADEGWL